MILAEIPIFQLLRLKENVRISLYGHIIILQN